MGIPWHSFHLSEEKGTNIRRKKKIDGSGIISIGVLMYGFIYAQGGIETWPFAIFIAFITFIFLLLNKYYVSYCQSCGKRIQHLGKKIKYCPSCGSGLSDDL